MNLIIKNQLSLLVGASLALTTSLYAEDLILNQIDIYSVTPLPSIGLPVEMIPSTVQIVKDKDIERQSGVSIADYLVNNIQGVTINEGVGNPFQIELNYRGYNATPIVGNPQGLSIYIDGIRANQPFSNNVLWDIIPEFAIENMQLMSGSNPVYGLNTLGGSMSMQTKSGMTFNKSVTDFSAGSWGRHIALAETGGVLEGGDVDYYFGYQYFEEDGWRDYSPTYVNQWFGKTGINTELSRYELSYTGAHNKMIGNGLTPKNLLGADMTGIHTLEDQTRNDYSQVALNSNHFINDEVLVSDNIYWRRLDQSTYNGDLNDEFCTAESLAEGECSSLNINQGVINRSTTKQDVFGANMQATFDQDWRGRKNQLVTGASYEYSLVKFKQSEQEIATLLSSGHLGGALEDVELSTDLKGKTETFGLFATNTHALSDRLILNTAARYNFVTVDNHDGKNAPGASASLTAEHEYDRLNSSVGLVFSPSKAYNIFANYSESSRAPTSIELGCSNPDEPCNLPTQMADDPRLNQVVAKTFEIGARGTLTNNMAWNMAAYDATNKNDILFVYASSANALGYFKNTDETTRHGIDLGLSGDLSDLSFSANYNYVLARYGADENFVSESNSSADANGSYSVKDGDYLPNIPKHSFKFRADYRLYPGWSLGATLTAFSDSLMMGNENDKHDSSTGRQGHVPGYTLLNLDSSYEFTGTLDGMRLYAKVNNVFDKTYYTGGRLAETRVNADRSFSDDDDGTLVASMLPGAPRAIWVGLKYGF